MNKGSKGNFKKTPGGRGIQRQQLKKGKKEMKKGIEDYHYYLGSATQFSDFEVTTEFVVNLMSQMMEYEPDININYSSPNEHVPVIERSIRVIKERVRATYHGLDFQKLPKVMIKMLVAESAKKLNFFPAKNGVSPFFSPRMILHGKTSS
jgi:copper oxidase (laccase) domain-containing protein